MSIGRNKLDAPKKRKSCANTPGASAPCTPAGRLEDAVIAEITGYILHPDVLAAAQRLDIETQAEQQAQIDAQRTAAQRELKTIRRKIKNITGAIAESGHSRALLDHLATLENQEAEIITRLETLSTPKTIPQMDIEQLHIIAANIQRILPTADIETKRRILRAFIHRITAERDSRTIRGLIEWYLPTNTARPPPQKTVPMDSSPVGAPIHRHSFTA